MADSLPSPPISRASTPQDFLSSADKDELADRLDQLLEQYLEVLDEYSNLREQLSKTFAEGFILLARAQRTSNLGPGRRYGQDGYDGRMKASKRVAIDLIKHESDSREAQDNTERPVQRKHAVSGDQDQKVHKFLVTSNSGSSSIKEELQTRSKSDTSVQKASIENLLESPTPASKNEDNQKQGKPKIDPAYRDPVTWYSILVPPPLRQAQKSFSLSVENLVPNLLTAASQLGSLESQIYALRTDIGIQSQYDENEHTELPHRSATGNTT